MENVGGGKHARRLEVPGGWLYIVRADAKAAWCPPVFVADPPLGEDIRAAARHLGLQDACTPMGAIETVGATFERFSETFGSAVHDVANAIENVSSSLDLLAEGATDGDRA